MRIATIPLGTLALLAVLAVGCASPSGKHPVRVTEEKQYIQLHHVRDTSQPVALKQGDAVAMVCSKCKTVLYANLNRPRTRFFTPLEHRHYCPGCRSMITVTGRGFGAREEVKHSCDTCGDESVFCCATTRGAPPTEGMENR